MIPSVAFPAFAAAAYEATSSNACQEDWPGNGQLPWQRLKPAASKGVAAIGGKASLGGTVQNFLPFAAANGPV